MLFEKQDWVLGKVLQKQSELNGDLPFIQFEDGPMPVSYTHLTLPTTPYV